MAKRGRPRKKRYETEELPRLRLSPHAKRGILVVVFILLSVVSFLAFFDAAGAMGEIITKVLRLLLGTAAVAAPLIFFGIGLALFLTGRREDDEEVPGSNLRVYIGSILFSFALTGVLHLVALRPAPDEAFNLVKTGDGGGYLGLLGSLPLFRFVDFWPSIAIFAALILISMLIVFNINLFALFKSSRAALERKQKTVGADTSIKINKMESPDFNVSKVRRSEVAVDEEQAPQSTPPEINIQEKLEKPGNYEVLAAKYRKGNWTLPAISLLDDSHDTVDSGNIEANVKIIQEALADFGIEVEMGEVNVGPTVTQYTLRPAQGIKLSQIVALQNDLALALAAPSIRIEAPIPGRSLVGIEIPNKSSAIVRIKDIIQTEHFVGHKSNLGFALGRDVAGHPLVADLARMPHMLIAGATGTGKSVAINSLLISFLYRNSPEELRLIVIDPKRVELNLYNGIPHLLTPVVTDHAKAVNALKWAVNEMDRRYNLLASAGKRNILEYNNNPPSASGRGGEDKLPYIVIIVDELADLMAVAQADVEAAVVRLAQMARAVGVHLVVATQRPSVDIITGLIKANITTRIAFAVASQVDSRTILDMGGAEKLLGSGDMLYITAELGKPKRIQGTYISEKEVKGVVDFVADQAGEVKYAEGILEKQRGSGSAGAMGDDLEDDDMLPEAVELVRQVGKASASLLQRRLRLGYARAARILDLMEQQGIIGPGDGAKPREVYYDDDQGRTDGADSVDEDKDSSNY